MDKQLEFAEKRIIKTGQGAKGSWVLYAYKDEEGLEYTSFNEYPLNTPIEIDYTEEEVPSRDGKRIFINRKIVKQIGGELPKEDGELLIVVKAIHKLLQEKL